MVFDLPAWICSRVGELTGGLLVREKHPERQMKGLAYEVIPDMDGEMVVDRHAASWSRAHDHLHDHGPL